ncbi:MAG: site-specific DNA-methyltransferase [Proteobacteria bacterium]|nr:site-specific DNA-methyltransferase [Pseudomonadota bacterium]MCL2307068.1 site-specific DNA-methyltransferase [Pseudomonadota bacterium]
MKFDNFDKVVDTVLAHVPHGESVKPLDKPIAETTVLKLKQAHKPTVSESRAYLIRTTDDAKSVASSWLEDLLLAQATSFGLPEVDDRYHIWRVPIKNTKGTRKIGEIVIDAYLGVVDEKKTTRAPMIEARLLKKDEKKLKEKTSLKIELSPLRNTIGLGDCIELLEDMPAESVDLVFTSPPYFNARPEYGEFDDYSEYLNFIRSVIRACARVLAEGRFFVMNTSPVLLRRASRNEASRRIAVPFDIHALFIAEGFEFIDDIIWAKPSGAGWATGRGRRFAADRNPLQYKAVPVTEYVLVYRKKTDKLIDWHIRNHPDRNAVDASKIADGYETTNIWHIQPNTRSPHPAPFPLELAEKVIRYYSFKGDVVLDPFAGSGTTGMAAVKCGRRFVLFDNNPEYVEWIREGARQWLGKASKEVLLLNLNEVNIAQEPLL